MSTEQCVYIWRWRGRLGEKFPQMNPSARSDGSRSVSEAVHLVLRPHLAPWCPVVPPSLKLVTWPHSTVCVYWRCFVITWPQGLPRPLSGLHTSLLCVYGRQVMPEGSRSSASHDTMSEGKTLLLLFFVSPSVLSVFWFRAGPFLLPGGSSHHFLSPAASCWNTLLRLRAFKNNIFWLALVGNPGMTS